MNAIEQLNQMNAIYQRHLGAVRKEYSNATMAIHARLMAETGEAHISDALCAEAKRRMRQELKAA